MSQCCNEPLQDCRGAQNIELLDRLKSPDERPQPGPAGRPRAGTRITAASAHRRRGNELIAASAVVNPHFQSSFVSLR